MHLTEDLGFKELGFTSSGFVAALAALQGEPPKQATALL
jgi:hypothetical protein